MTAGELAARLEGRPAGDGWTARCPAHDDTHPSLSITEGDHGRVLLHCHAQQCDPAAIVSALGLTLQDIAGNATKNAKATIKATYDYKDEHDALLFQVVRFEPKDFRQRRPDGKGGWIWTLGSVRRVVFGLPDLRRRLQDPEARAAREARGLPHHGVVVVEGEKDAEVLGRQGLVATTNAGGAGKWRDDYARQILEAGAESVIAIPDNDEPGRQHAEAVAASCHAAGLSVRIVPLPGLPAKGDVSDFLAGPGDRLPELLALVAAAPAWTPSDATAPLVRNEPHPVLVRLADVQPEAVTWLWPGRLAAGKLTLLVGDPGLGKSWITLDIAARVSAGRGWPDGASATDPANALLLSAEDGLADTIRPRLDALGADVTRVHHLAVLRCGEHERAIQLADTDMLERAISETGARVLVIDPVSAYLGTTDSHRDAEVRALLAPLAAVAERTGAAVLGVMHLCKGTQRPAIYRAVGSIAFAASARIVLAVAADPEHDGRRILAGVKSNLSAAPAALAYVLTDGRLTWDAAPVSDVDVEALLSGPMSPRDRGEQTDAEHVIRELLEDEAAWPLSAQEALDAGRQQGIPERTLRWTARRLGIRIDRAGFGARGKWLWHRPSIAAGLAPMDDDIEKPQSISIAAYRGNESASCRYVAPMENIKENERFPASDAHSGKGPCDDDVL